MRFKVFCQHKEKYAKLDFFISGAGLADDEHSVTPEKLQQKCVSIQRLEFTIGVQAF